MDSKGRPQIQDQGIRGGIGIAREDRTMEGIFGILLAATGLVGPLGPATGLVGPLGPRRAAQLSASRQAGVWLMAPGPPTPLAGPPRLSPFTL